MEYCELGDLSHFIKKRDRLDTFPVTQELARKYPSQGLNAGLHEVVIRHFLKQLASALEFLRSKNYVHRDVKPQNLLLLPPKASRGGSASRILEGSQGSLIPVAGVASLPMLKLADFGFARVLPSTSLADTLCGSPLYMAPEILRYERYDAKADLWSVGTVLYEMAAARPPFRARNHVELLRKIEAAEDVIKYPREVTVSPEMKALTRALLKRSPVERLTFENFFSHPVVTGEIPGLVEDDVPRPTRPIPEPDFDIESHAQRDSKPPSRAGSLRSRGYESPRESGSGSPRDQVGRTPPTGSPRPSRRSDDITRPSSSPRDAKDGLGIRRPVPQHSATAPNHPRLSDKSARTTTDESRQTETQRGQGAGLQSPVEDDNAAQDVMFERDYVVVERRHVEVNALADELAANQAQSPRVGQMTRRATQQGVPTSATGAIPTPASRTALVAQGRASHDRRSSYEKALSASPGSASSAISKAIQDASLRLFGFKVSPMRTGKGPSPPFYQPFPDYPTPATAGLISDGKNSQPTDEDVRSAQTIEDFATRSDCVYGFAEVKFKQLIPIAPSGESLGGVRVDEDAEDDGLTLEAVVSVAEEALVLYVKSLALLAKAMDIASYWWSKSRGDVGSGVSATAYQLATQRINAVVQWVRGRFNEVLEKSEVVRLKLTEAQKLLPEDHPNYPANQQTSSIASSAESNVMKNVYLTPGINAEKLMWDRALEMSRAAAIDEVTNSNLPGCELSYITAIRMLEAILDSDDETPPKRLASKDDDGAGADSDEDQHVKTSKFRSAA